MIRRGRHYLAPGGYEVRCLVACLALLFPAMPLVRAEDPARTLEPPSVSTYDAFTQYARFLEVVIENYIDPAGLQQLNQHTAAALRAFLRSLDEEADLFTADERESPAAKRGKDPVVAFGATLAVDRGYPVVVTPRDGTPAQRVGLLAGETITAINDEPTRGRRLHEIGRQLDGPPGSQFILTILDPAHGSRSIVVNRLRDAGATPARMQRLAPDLVYLRIPALAFPVAESLHQFAEQIREERIRAAILDLRNNPGGPLNAAVVAVSLFMPVRQEIVSLVHPRQDNDGTANEAEVFAAALRRHQAARLVGTRTYGRGRVFSTFRLPDGARVRLPTAYYRTPAGDRLDQGGLEPDVVVTLPRETERALAGFGYGAFDWTRQREQVLEKDRQLARAVEILTR